MLYKKYQIWYSKIPKGIQIRVGSPWFAGVHLLTSCPRPPGSESLAETSQIQNDSNLLDLNRPPKHPQKFQPFGPDLPPPPLLRVYLFYLQNRSVGRPKSKISSWILVIRFGVEYIGTHLFWKADSNAKQHTYVTVQTQLRSMINLFPISTRVRIQNAAKNIYSFWNKHQIHHLHHQKDPT